jgi:hypothetical protein
MTMTKFFGFALTAIVLLGSASLASAQVQGSPSVQDISGGN